MLLSVNGSPLRSLLLKQITTHSKIVHKRAIQKYHQLTLFNPDSTKSKIVKFSKITNWVKLKNKQHHSKVLNKAQQLSNERSHLRVTIKVDSGSQRVKNDLRTDHRIDRESSKTRPFESFYGG